MTNFIFKSSKRLIKNVDNTLIGHLLIIKEQNRFLRQDLVDVKLMINKLLIDKHLQNQVDTYFNEDKQSDDSSI